MPGSASSSSLDAVLMFTAASANAENSSIASSNTNRFIFPPQGLLSCATMLSAARRAGKQRAHATRNAFLDRQHRRGVALRAQPRQVGLGEALVFAGESRREAH